MGQMELKTALKGVTHPNKNLFEFQELIGLGGFGKVWKVQYKKTKQILALKELSKRIILDENLLELTFKERDILSSLYSPYISNLYCTFQDKENLYIVLDYLPGKDLRFKIKTLKRNFTEEEIRFIAGNVILGLEYIHSNGIIHRDIKPANLVFDNKGYIRISDFGIAVYYSNKDDIPPAGTPGYFAPECIMNRYKFFYSADFFNLGIILYEIVKKQKPFKSTTVSNLIEEFSTEEIKLTTKDLNNCNYSENLCDFINKMLVINPKDRIGSNNNVEEIKNHPFFSGLNWKHLYHKTIRSPFKNDNIENKKIEDINYNDEPLDEESQKKFLNFTILHQIDFSNPLTYNSNLINKNVRKSKSNFNENFPKKKITPLKITNIKLKNDIYLINSNNEISHEMHLPLMTASNINKKNSFRKVNDSHNESSFNESDEPIIPIKQSKTLRKSNNFGNSLNKVSKNKERRSSLFDKSIEKTLKEFNMKKGKKK